MTSRVGPLVRMTLAMGRLMHGAGECRRRRDGIANLANSVGLRSASAVSRGHWLRYGTSKNRGRHILLAIRSKICCAKQLSSQRLRRGNRTLWTTYLTATSVKHGASRTSLAEHGNVGRGADARALSHVRRCGSANAMPHGTSDRMVRHRFSRHRDATVCQASLKNLGRPWQGRRHGGLRCRYFE